MRKTIITAVAAMALSFAADATTFGQTQSGVKPVVFRHGHAHHAPCVEKECIAVPTQKKKSKAEYKVECRDFCTKGFPGLRRLFHRHKCGCGEPDCPKCGRVRTKRVLMKRIVPDGVEHGYKCEVVHKAPCPMGCAPGCEHEVAPVVEQTAPLQMPTVQTPAATEGTPVLAIPGPVEQNINH